MLTGRRTGSKETARFFLLGLATGRGGRESCLISGSASLLLRVVKEIVGEWCYYEKKGSSWKNRVRSEHGVNRLIAGKTVFVERRGLFQWQ